MTPGGQAVRQIVLPAQEVDSGTFRLPVSRIATSSSDRHAVPLEGELQARPPA